MNALRWLAAFGLWLSSLVAAAPAGAPLDEAVLAARADKVIEALAHRDFAALAAQVHPDRGLALAPYARDLTELFVTGFRRDQVAAFGSDDALHQWGWYDGIGEPIRLTAREYFDQFVYDMDYAGRAERSLERAQDRVQSDLAALYAAYPEAVIVHYHFAGTEEIGYKDFRDLILVFSLQDGEWHLAALAHGESTL